MKDLYCQLSENPIAVLAAKGGGKFEKRSVSAELMVKIYALNFAIFLYYGLNWMSWLISRLLKKRDLLMRKINIWTLKIKEKLTRCEVYIYINKNRKQQLTGLNMEDKTCQNIK